MEKVLDVNCITPFLQSTVSVFESVTQIQLTAGHPATEEIFFHAPTYVISVGIVGQMKGKAVFSMSMERAKEIAGKMLFGIPVAEWDEMACSALNELCNMIMGNTATIFSTQGKIIEITPPISMLRSDLVNQSDFVPISVPLLRDGVEYLRLYLYIYVHEE